ncbi:hypothetical protein EON67_07205, partial [archaeon]
MPRSAQHIASASMCVQFTVHQHAATVARNQHALRGAEEVGSGTKDGEYNHIPGQSLSSSFSANQPDMLGVSMVGAAMFVCTG